MYSSEFRKSAVSMVINGNVPVKLVAKRLEISSTALYGWLKKWREGNIEHLDKKKNSSDVELAIVKLKLAKAKREIKQLKKTVRYYIKVTMRDKP